MLEESEFNHLDLDSRYCLVIGVVDIDCRCQTILRRYMLRRKKDSELDGRKLITLPEKHVELRVLEFSPEERDICESCSTGDHELSLN